MSQNDETYFIIHSDEDGTRVVPVTKKELLKRIAEEYYGPNMKALPKIPDSDKGYWMAPEGSYVIIKGKIIMPDARQVVTQYDVE